MQYSGQQPVTIVTQNIQHGDQFKRSAAKQMVVLSSLQLAIGILCMIFGIVLLALNRRQSLFIPTVGYGIWIGAYFVVVGGFGIGAGKRNNACMITGCMILNIICAAACCTTLVGLTSTGIASSYYHGCERHYYECRTGAFIAMDSLMLVMAIAQLVFAIWSAVLCCGAVCRCCKPSSSVPMMQVHYSQGQNFQAQPLFMAPNTNVQVQQATYPVGVHQQQQAYMMQSGQPGSYMMPAAQSTGYMVPAAQPAGYVAQPGQPVGYMAQPSPSTVPPAYSGASESTSSQKQTPAGEPPSKS